MKTLNTNIMGMLGLLGALAINSSPWWSQNKIESGDFASKSNSSIEKCIRDAMNKSHYKEEIFKCEDKKSGFKVTGTLKEVTRNKDGQSVSTDGKRSVTERIKRDNPTPPPSDTRVAPTDTVKSLVAKITVAATTVPGCKDCETKIRSEELFRDIEGGKRSDFSDDPDVMTGQLIDQTKDLMAAIDGDLKEHNKAKRQKEKLERNWKLCKHDENGEKFEDDEDLNSCFTEQLNNLTGKELASFVNTRFFPHLMKLSLSNPEAGAELRDILENGIDRGGQNGGFLKGSLTNFDHFLHDYKLRSQAIQKARSDSSIFPTAAEQQSYMTTELKRINQTFSTYANQTMGSEGSMNPAYGPQFEAIQRTLSTGQPPQSLWNDLGSDFASNEGSLFSSDMAERALGVRSRITDLYPEYSRSGTVPSRQESMNRTGGRIQASLDRINPTLRNKRK